MTCKHADAGCNSPEGECLGLCLEAGVEQEPVQCEPVLIEHPLTWRKVTSVQERGYKITGYTLTNDRGQKCVVDMASVRWFDDGADFFRMMHPSPDAKNSAARIAELEAELSTERCLSFRNQVAELEKRRDGLLALLEKARDGLCGGLWDFGPGQDEHDQCNELVAEIDAAIDAAKGGGK